MTSFWKPFAIVLVGVLLTSSGQALVAKCLRNRPAANASTESARPWRRLCGAFGERRAAIGLVLMVLALPLGVLVLAMADVSVAIPLGAMSYVLATFLGRYYLGEQVGPLRWIGTIVIVVGTVLVGLSVNEPK